MKTNERLHANRKQALALFVWFLAYLLAFTIAGFVLLIFGMMFYAMFILE